MSRIVKVEPMVGTDWNLVTVGWPDSCVGAVVLDRQFHIVALTDSLTRRSGYDATALIGTNALGLVHPRDRARVLECRERLDRSPQASDGQALIRMKDRFGYEGFGVEVANAPHDDGLIIMHLHEISAELRSAELARDLGRAVRELGGRFSLGGVADAVQDLTDRQFNGAAICVTIFADEGRPMVFPARSFTGELVVANALAGQRAPEAVDERRTKVRTGDGQHGQHDPATPRRVVFPMFNDQESCLGYLEVIRPWDTTPTSHEWLVYGSVAEVMHAAAMRYRLNSALQWAADHDSLTGLLNRRGFVEATKDATNGVVFVADLDNFSSINNEHGHAAGDDALAAASRRLKEVAPLEAVLARLGGDEFVGWLPGATINDGERLTRDWLKSLERRVTSQDHDFVVQASIGLVVVAAGEVVEHAIRRADAAMYLAKAKGGNSSVSAAILVPPEIPTKPLAGNIWVR